MAETRRGAGRSRSLGLAAMFKRNGQLCKNLLKDRSNWNAITWNSDKMKGWSDAIPHGTPFNTNISFPFGFIDIGL